MGEEKKPLVMRELGCADGCGPEMGQSAWVQRGGWKWVGRRSCWRSASLAARTAADGKWLRRIARTAADDVGAREWLEMGGEKKPLEISELGCADGCGREMVAENCADGCRRREWLEMGGEKKPLVVSELGCADGCGREMGSENCADGCGRRGCEGVAGNGWGEEAAGDERAWLRARLRTAADGKWVGTIARTVADGVGAREWLEMGGEKKLLENSKLGCADGCGRKWMRGIARTAADGMGAREVLEMGGEKKPLKMSELGCADGCGREEVRRIARTAADGVGAREWLEMGGEKKPPC